MCVTQLARVTATRGPVAVVDLGGRAREVPLVALGDEARAVVPGDWLMVHTGLAVRRLDAAEAAGLAAALEALAAGPTDENGTPCTPGGAP